MDSDRLSELVDEILLYAGRDELMVSDVLGAIIRTRPDLTFEETRVLGSAVTGYLVGAGWAEPGDLENGRVTEPPPVWHVWSGSRNDWFVRTAELWMNLTEDPQLGGPFLLHLTPLGLEEMQGVLERRDV